MPIVSLCDAPPAGFSLTHIRVIFKHLDNARIWFQTIDVTRMPRFNERSLDMTNSRGSKMGLAVEIKRNFPKDMTSAQVEQELNEWKEWADKEAGLKIAGYTPQFVVMEPKSETEPAVPPTSGPEKERHKQEVLERVAHSNRNHREMQAAKAREDATLISRGVRNREIGPSAGNAGSS